MWSSMAVGVLALVLATDVVRTQACSSPNPQPSPAPGGEVFTTADGVRFSVDVVATNLQIPWSLAFAPDGLLYITTGDASHSSRAQDVASLAGKILRINRDGTTPPDNPFSSPVYSYGHRNPQGIDWHPVTGILWESEHGNTGNDEINIIERGLNYGWPRIEGSQTMPGMQPPITFYSPAIAPSGASFYRGHRFPAFANNFFVAALRGM